MVAIPYADLAPVCRDVFSILISPFLMHPISLIYSGDQHWGEQMAKRMPTSADYGPAQVLYEVTASGIDQDYIEDVLNSNRLRERTSDTRGDGIFDMECDLPFVYNGVTYTDCTDVDSSSSSGGVPWCSTKVDADSLQHITGHWGNCLPSPEELIQESSYSDHNTCTGMKHLVCSSRSNYGTLDFDWNEGSGNGDAHITMNVWTPHEEDAYKLASSHKIVL